MSTTDEEGNYPVTPTLLVLVSSLLSVCVISWLWKRRNEGAKDPISVLPLPPGNMGWPLIRENLQFFLKGSDFFVERFKKYGRIYKTHVFGAPMVRLSGADYIRPLVSKEPNLMTMKITQSARYLFGGQSLTSVTGEEHPKLKKKLLAALTPVRLDDYLPCIQDKVRAHVLDWCDRGHVLGFPACDALMAELVLELTLGWSKDNDPMGVVRNAFITVNQNMISVPLKIPGTGFYKAAKAKKVITDFIKKRLSRESDKDHVCILDVLLVGHGEDGRDAGLTEEQIIDNAVTFLIAGSGTTSGALSCLLLMLGKHPEVLSKLREELSSKGLIETEKDIPLTYDLLQELDYVQWLNKEVLRLLPPVGGVFRQAEKTVEVGDYQIPKGWTVMYSIRDTHFNTHVFEHRDEFIPERWGDKDLEATLRKTEACNYLPFGSGPRSCLGKALALVEMSVFLVEVARVADWKLHNPDARMVYLPVTKCADDMPVTFTRRC
ncbi:unnamed protein product [Lymnaea stagnalis]|uniref:Cytochrome P450 n=1 Tax=Lymnaea stagnalis TaxID=6523 RepID=A0AAV2IJM7_LYMST